MCEWLQELPIAKSANAQKSQAPIFDQSRRFRGRTRLRRKSRSLVVATRWRSEFRMSVGVHAYAIAVLCIAARYRCDCTDVWPSNSQHATKRVLRTVTRTSQLLSAKGVRTHDFYALYLYVHYIRTCKCTQHTRSRRYCIVCGTSCTATAQHCPERCPFRNIHPGTLSAAAGAGV